MIKANKATAAVASRRTAQTARDYFDEVGGIDADDAAETLLASIERALSDDLADLPIEDDDELERTLRRRSLDAEAQMRKAVDWMMGRNFSPVEAPTRPKDEGAAVGDDPAPAPAVDAIRPPAKWEPREYAHPPIAGCYLDRQSRAGYLAVVADSGLHESAKRFLRWLIGFKHDALSMGVAGIAEKINGKDGTVSARTIQRLLRQFDDTTLDGVGVLRMIAEARSGTRPRVYAIDLRALTYIALEKVAGKASKTSAEARQKSRKAEKDKRKGAAVTTAD